MTLGSKALLNSEVESEQDELLLVATHLAGAMCAHAPHDTHFDSLTINRSVRRAELLIEAVRGSTARKKKLNKPREIERRDVAIRRYVMFQLQKDPDEETLLELEMLVLSAGYGSIDDFKKLEIGEEDEDSPDKA